MDRGIFIISLDLELMWGMIGAMDAEGYMDNILGEAGAVSGILDLFAKFGIHSTWASVGALACKDKHQLLHYMDKQLKYPELGFDMGEYLAKIGGDEETDKLHFGRSLIKCISGTPGQYIGLHSFSHLYCLEEGIKREDMRRDLEAALAVFREIGIDARSYVFPRNQVKGEFLDILSRCGIKCYRGCQKPGRIKNLHNATKYSERNKSVITRIVRFMDRYIPIGGYYDYPLVKDPQSTILNLPGSRRLDPIRTGILGLLEPLKVLRVRNEMKRAAQKGTIYHLWWHPHNFGKDTNRNLHQLKLILEEYKRLQKRYGFESLAMEEVAEGYGSCGELMAQRGSIR